MQGVAVTALFDSGSESSLIQESFFKHNIEEHISEADLRKFEGEEHEFNACNGSNGNPLNIKNVVEVNFRIGSVVLRGIPFLVVEDSPVTNQEQVTVGWNLIKLAHRKFVKNLGAPGLDSFIKPAWYNPALFAAVCIYHHCKYTYLKQHEQQQHLKQHER